MNDSDRKACATCGTELARSELVWTSKGEVCSGCAEKAEAPPPLNLPPWPVLLALVFGVAPFFAEAVTTSSVTMNGGVISYHSYDFVAIPAGAAGLVLGIWALIGQLKLKPRHKLHLWLAALSIPLGLMQLLVRGLGLLG